MRGSPENEEREASPRENGGVHTTPEPRVEERKLEGSRRHGDGHRLQPPEQLCLCRFFIVG